MEEIVLPAPLEVRTYSMLDMPAWGGRASALREHSVLDRKRWRKKTELWLDKLEASRRGGIRFSRRFPAIKTGSSSFTPGDVTSVSKISWVRADLGYTIVTGVSSWEDQFAGGTGDFAQATEAAQPVRTASGGPNGFSYITGDGTDDEMTSSIDRPAPGTTPTYIACVARQESYTIGDRFFAGNVSGTAIAIRTITGDPQICMNNGSNVNTNANMTTGSWFVLQAGFFATTSDFIKVGSGSKTSGSSAGTANPGAFSIFGAVGALWANVSFAELMMYAGEPSAGELAGLAGYWSKTFELAA